MSHSTDHPGSPLVLIMDHPTEETTRIVRCLKEYNIEGRVLLTAAEAFTCLEQETVHGILSECLLPDLSAAEFLLRVRQRPQTADIPFIIMTQEPELDNRLQTMSLDIDDYIAKPYYPEEVAARIDVVVRESIRSGMDSVAVEASFTGRLEDLNLNDLLQIMATGQKTGVISLCNEQKQGTVGISRGLIWYSQMQALESETALLQLVLWTAGTFQVQLLPELTQERTLHYENKDLAQWAARLLEARRLLSPWLSSLETAVVASKSALQRLDLTEKELSWVRHLDQPQSVLSLLAHPDTAVQSLHTCRELLEQGLLEIVPDHSETHPPFLPPQRQKEKAAEQNNKTDDRPNRFSNFFRPNAKKISPFKDQR